MENRRTTRSRSRSRQSVKREMEDKNIRVVRKPRRPVKKGPRVGTIMVLLCFVFFVIYVSGSVFKFMNKQTIPSTEIQYGSIDSPEILKGALVRNEKVYNSTADGVLYYNLSNYDRVRKNEAVCSVQNDTEIEKIQKNIENLDSSIMKTQETRDDYSLFKEDVRKLNDNMKNIVEDNMYKYLGSSTVEIYNMKSNLDKHMGVRNQMLLTENRGSLVTMVQEKSIFEGKLNQNIASINSVESGILSYTVDGYEEEFTFEEVDNITMQQIEGEFTQNENLSNREIKKDSPIFKIVESNEWYIVSYIKNVAIGNLQEGIYAKVYIKNDSNDTYKEQEVYIQKLVPGESESYVVMKTTKGMLDFIDKRIVDFKVTDGVYEGLKIPNSAIVDKSLLKIPTSYVQNDGTNVYLIKQVLEKSVNIPVVLKGTDETGEISYVLQDFTNINLGDTILRETATDPFQISEVESSKGVYLLNSGIAEFRKINVDEDTPSNSAYTILDPKKNVSIRAHDRIVSDTKNILEGQTIF